MGNAQRAKLWKEQLDSLRVLRELFERGEMRFPPLALSWLKQTEDLAWAEDVPIASMLTVLRVQLFSVEDQTVLEQGLASRKALRDTVYRVSADALGTADELLHRQLEQDTQALGDMAESLRQAVMAVAQAQLFHASLPEQHREHWLAECWAILSSYEPTRGFAVYLTASMVAEDRLYLLDAIMP